MSDFFRIIDLGKTYVEGTGKKLSVLENLNFSFSENNATAIVGPSGTGKSTLLHVLGGLDTPSKGEVLFREENIYKFSADRLSEWRNQHIGFVFQFNHLLPDFTAWENVFIPMLMSSNQSREDASKKAKKLLEMTSMEHRLTHKPSELSGGEQQRVAIARALINSPSLILAVEPTGNLDEKTSNQVCDLLLEATQENNTTLLMVTHNHTLADRLDIKLELSKNQLHFLTNND